jgi:hypothetical protein
MPIFPRKNPHIILPYSSKRETRLSHHFVARLVTFRTNGWTDLLGFLCIFSTKENPTVQFNYNTFLVENIHDQFSKFATEGMFQYSSILANMFTFFQEKRFSFFMQKMDKEEKPLVITFWTSLLRRNSAELSFK